MNWQEIAKLAMDNWEPILSFVLGILTSDLVGASKWGKSGIVQSIPSAIKAIIEWVKRKKSAPVKELTPKEEEPKSYLE